MMNWEKMAKLCILNGNLAIYGWQQCGKDYQKKAKIISKIIKIKEKKNIVYFWQ